MAAYQPELSQQDITAQETAPFIDRPQTHDTKDVSDLTHLALELAQEATMIPNSVVDIRPTPVLKVVRAAEVKRELTPLEQVIHDTSDVLDFRMRASQGQDRAA